MGPGDLARALCGLTFPTDANLIVGLDRPDDAGVYRVTESLALIQTVDFFTPIVDDPYMFGQIAAANALSDIYAMGGAPKTAMNLVAFPVKDMEMSVLRDIIRGGIDKMREAGVVLVGGHSIEDRELKYGLSVTGFVHPDRVLTKGNLKAGDRLILTKALGTGIVNTAVKGGVASPEDADRAARLMAGLNKRAAEIMESFPVHACTDITGFGFLGHVAEMIAGSGLSVRIQAGQLPVLQGALGYAAMGLIPAGMYRNRDFRESMTTIEPGVDRAIQDILFDPQTSGGLLIAIGADHTSTLAEALRSGGVETAAIVGEVLDDPAERMIVTP